MSHAHEESDNTETVVQEALDYEEIHGEIPDELTLIALREQRKQLEGALR